MPLAVAVRVFEVEDWARNNTGFLIKETHVVTQWWGSANELTLRIIR